MPGAIFWQDLRRKVSPSYVKQPVLILVKIEEVTEHQCT